MMLGNSIFYLSKGDYRVEEVGFAALDLGLRTSGLKFKLRVVEVEGMGGWQSRCTMPLRG